MQATVSDNEMHEEIGFSSESATIMRPDGIFDFSEPSLIIHSQPSATLQITSREVAIGTNSAAEVVDTLPKVASLQIEDIASNNDRIISGLLKFCNTAAFQTTV